jgi:DegV family protein with EDD domain
MTEARYRLATDSCCDLPASLVDELDVAVLEFPFQLDGEQHFDDLGRSMPASEFFRRMRAGSTPTTAQVPLAEYLAAFMAAAEDAVPLLFLSFSSGLSGTYDAALVARERVLVLHPEADIRVIDTLSASAHQGLLVLDAARKRDEGLTVDELERWVEAHKLCVNGCFTTETLEALRRGGRVSDVAAMAGTMLDVKPLLRVNRCGELVVDRVVRGRKKSMRAIVDTFVAGWDAGGGRTVVVAHADAPQDAEALSSMLRERAQVEDILVCELGPVVGSHTGPGMVAVCFWGPERRP